MYAAQKKRDKKVVEEVVDDESEEVRVSCGVVVGGCLTERPLDPMPLFLVLSPSAIPVFVCLSVCRTTGCCQPSTTRTGAHRGPPLSRTSLSLTPYPPSTHTHTHTQRGRAAECVRGQFVGGTHAAPGGGLGRGLRAALGLRLAGRGRVRVGVRGPGRKGGGRRVIGVNT